jgi:hypothetical protein
MFLGCLLLLLVWKNYDFKTTAPKAMAPIQTPAYALGSTSEIPANML